MLFGLDKRENQSKEELELQSYLQYLNSAMAPLEMKKLIRLINELTEAKYQEGFEEAEAMIED
jgi:hypothetical protein